jgi:uncharacterized protein (TIGR03437 family)
VYTTDGTQAIAVHGADYSLATAARPLDRGEYAFVYVSGLGAVSNAPTDGAAAPSGPLAMASSEVRVTLGGMPCEVQFAGLAPGFAGVYQVNFRVPAAAGSGSQALVVSGNGVASPEVRVDVR